jgi:hypothetical protein
MHYCCSFASLLPCSLARGQGDAIAVVVLSPPQSIATTRTAAQFLAHIASPPPMLHPRPVSTSVGAKVKALGHIRRRAPCQSVAELQARRGRPEPEPLCSLSRASCIPHKP